ncbi:MAG: hypothetical protein KAT70_03695 [Thermoplasmata archaeon]|nr:hypothetical protein [Thermoplasmata archaeon]
MLEQLAATVLGIALGYIVYKTFLESLRQALQPRLEAFLENRQHKRMLRRETRYRLFIE